MMKSFIVPAYTVVCPRWIGTSSRESFGRTSTCRHHPESASVCIVAMAWIWEYHMKWIVCMSSMGHRPCELLVRCVNSCAHQCTASPNVLLKENPATHSPSSSDTWGSSEQHPKSRSVEPSASTFYFSVIAMRQHTHAHVHHKYLCTNTFTREHTDIWTYLDSVLVSIEIQTTSGTRCRSKKQKQKQHKNKPCHHQEEWNIDQASRGLYFS